MTALPPPQSTSNPGASVAANQWTIILRPTLIAIAWVSICWCPLLIHQVGTLLERPHYQFIVFLPLAAFMIARSRWKKASLDKVAPGRSSRAFACASLVLAIVAVSSLLRSPWLGFIGYLLSIPTVIYAVGGKELTKVFLPGWVMLCLAISLPFNLDEQLVLGLRDLVTQWTSHVLHLLGVLHLVEGNVVKIPGKAFFVADACTGIHSLFVVVTAAIFIGLLFERRVLHVMLLAASAAGLVLIENVSRLSGVVLAYQYGVDISEGIAHDAFGLLLFAVTLLLVLSADQFVAFLLPSRLLFWRRKANRSAVRRKAEGHRSHHARLPSPMVTRAFGATILCIGAVQLWAFPLGLSWSHAPVEMASKTSVPELGESFLPDAIEGYKRTAYHFDTHPVAVHYLSDFSQVWEYSGDGVNLKFSLDYPYPSVHDLCLCYELTGWTIRKKELHVRDDQAASTDAQSVPFVFAEMDKPVDGTGYILFSYFNSRGDEGVRLYPLHKPSAMQRIRRRVNSLLGTQPESRTEDQGPTEWNAGLPGPVLQVQLLVQSPRELTAEQLAHVEQFFVAAREELRSRYIAFCASASE